jgi:rhamnosyltransferase
MIMVQTSIILLTKNGGIIFCEVIEKLLACRGIDQAEILMIDSGSTDLTKEYARQYSKIQLFEIESSDFGHGKTRNLGASLAKGNILIFLVQDAVPAHPHFLEKLIAPFADTQVAGVYGRQLPRPTTNPVEKFFLESTYPDLPAVRTHNLSGRSSIGSIFFSNVNSAIRRKVWEQVPFDESLIMSEDQQWAKEVLLKGYAVVYEPAAAVFHAHNYGLSKVFQRNFDSGCSLRGVVKDSLAHMARYELNFLLAGIRQLAQWGSASYIPYFLLNEAARSLGFALGQQSHLLPNWAKYYLSLHKYYWRR